MTNPPMEAEKFHVWLKDAGGCVACRSWSRGKDLRTIWDTCQRGDWLAWLLNACGYQWTAPAYEAYHKAAATAEKAYQKATAPDHEAYHKAKATAEKAYHKAKATSIREIIPYPFVKEGK